MTTAFRLAVETPPSLRQFVEALAIPDLGWRSSDPQAPDWPDGVVEFFREKLSTRCTTVSHFDGFFNVVTYVLATCEDGDLALKMVRSVAEATGVDTVSVGTVGDTPIGDVETALGADWVNEMAASATIYAASMIKPDGSPVVFPGPIRPFFLGHRFLENLRGQGPENELHVRLVAALRRLQWADKDTDYQSVTIHKETPNPDYTYTWATWLGTSVLFPAVDYVAIRPDPTVEEQFLIPATALPSVAADRWTYLDELQGLVDDCQSDWQSVVDRARPHETTPSP